MTYSPRHEKAAALIANAVIAAMTFGLMQWLDAPDWATFAVCFLVWMELGTRDEVKRTR